MPFCRKHGIQIFERVLIRPMWISEKKYKRHMRRWHGRA